MINSTLNRPHQPLNNRNYMTLSSSSPSPHMTMSAIVTSTTTTPVPVSQPRPSTIRTTYLKSHQSNRPIISNNSHHNHHQLSLSSSPTRSIQSMKETCLADTMATQAATAIGNEFNYLLTMTTGGGTNTGTLTNSGHKTNKLMKMNQIEDALASVLDDMKQLDFSSSSSNLTNTSSGDGSKQHQHQHQQGLSSLSTDSSNKTNLPNTPNGQKVSQSSNNTPPIQSGTYSAFKFAGTDFSSSPESLSKNFLTS